MICPANGKFEYDVLLALGDSGTLSGSLPGCETFSILTVQPEHARAKPATMRTIKTAFKKFISTPIAQV
jgi:hypothetical protein